jgi:hypothetical protein
MSIEMVGYIFLGWLAMGTVAALLLGRVLRESSGLPVPATAAVGTGQPVAARRSTRRNGQRSTRSAA